MDYENQTEISDDRVKMANACMLHYGGDPRWLARFCGNEFTDEHRDIEATLREIEKDSSSRDGDTSHIRFGVAILPR